MLYVLVLFLFLEPSACVIYSINETDYLRMPALYAIDAYDACMAEPDGTYCVVDFDLFSRQRSSLMHFIQEYSAYTKKHFNHTQIHRAVCVTSTCKNYLPQTLNTTVDLNSTLERCLNETIWKNYGIEAKVSKINDCSRKDEKSVITKGDIAVAGIYAVIILLNMVGTFYDIIISKSESKTGNKYLLAFSLKMSWGRLVAASGKGPDTRLERLKGMNGIRSIIMVCVIFSHTVLVVTLSYVVNPLHIEKLYDDITKHIIFNGTLVTFTFFVMSAFLLVYNFLIHIETHEISWFDFPKGVFLRWIRLTPSYGLVLGTIATLMRHFGSGPFWKIVVVSESDACRDKWWTNILYINNYMYGDSNCLPQTWYLAADTQLFCFSLLVLVLARTARARKIAVVLMFLLSLAITAGVTYYKKLEAIVLHTPESIRNLYADNETFKQMYIPGHTNLSSYVLGFAGAMITYHWQNEKKDFTKYKGYVWAYWLLLPASIAVILTGGFFFIDGMEPSLLFKTLYATFYKVIYQMIIVSIMIGCIFKFENIYRSIIEWRGFTWMGRVSYSAFLVHTIFQRCFLGTQMELTYLSDYYVLVLLNSSLFSSYLIGTSLYLFVESPVAALVKAVLAPSRDNTTQQDDK